MAKETRGLLSEAVLKVALEQAIKINKWNLDLFWNVKPTGLSMEPDFTIGDDPEKPEFVILVTSSSATHGSHLKTWRNLAEFQEAKVNLPLVPRIISVYFRSDVKKVISKTTEIIFDAELKIEETTYGDKLIAWIDNNSKSIGNDQNKLQELVKDEINKKQEFYNSINFLVKDLSKLLSKENKELKALWKLMRKNKKSSREIPEVKKTYIRRGLAKLSVIPENSRKVIYENYKNKRIPSTDLPDYVFKLNFYSKTLGGATWTEYGQEILEALKLIGPETCERILKRCPDSMMSWINPLRNLDRIHVHVDFIENHYEEVIDPEKLCELLKKCHEDPAKLSGHPSDEKVWIFEIIMSLIRVSTKRLQGYGYSDLSKDTEIYEIDSKVLLRFVLPKFIQRKLKLDNETIKKLSRGLSYRFKNEINISNFKELRKSVEDFVVNENLEGRLIPYRNFEPLLWLILVELEKKNIKFEPVKPWGGWLNDFTAIGTKSLSTRFIRSGSTMIHWKTSNGSHTRDKTKELSARVRNVRYQFKNNSFSHREGIKQFFLIIDGTFTEKDLLHLSDAGWDRIFYADQMDELVQAIV